MAYRIKFEYSKQKLGINSKNLPCKSEEKKNDLMEANIFIKQIIDSGGVVTSLEKI